MNASCSLEQLRSDGNAWCLEVRDEKDGTKSLQFHPPSGIGQAHEYILRSVKIEPGARTVQEPFEMRRASSYAAQQFPKHFSQRDTPQLRVLSPARTFWEKATLLHQLFHRPADKPLQARISRHHYDVVRLNQSAWGETRNDIALLKAVATWKSVYFRDAKAHYETAQPLTLRLAPASQHAQVLAEDFAQMQPMFFPDAEPLNWTQITQHLQKSEAHINSK